ncbi:hypothetical protein J8391_12300 [Acinetobacter baumannii]|nr:hypothetical protein [Acinetobacter baumannii]
MKTLFFPLFLIIFVLMALDQSYQKKIGISKPQKHPEFMQ